MCLSFSPYQVTTSLKSNVNPTFPLFVLISSVFEKGGSNSEVHTAALERSIIVGKRMRIFYFILPKHKLSHWHL
jgi:hypothetical protein